MHLNDDPLSLYDVLELTPDATPQEIRSAYLRLKSSYGKDNIAHYTVFSREETESMLQNIEAAYLTLSNPERRRHYDVNQGFHSAGGAILPSSMGNFAGNNAQGGFGNGMGAGTNPGLVGGSSYSQQNSGSAGLAAQTFGGASAPSSFGAAYGGAPAPSPYNTPTYGTGVSNSTGDISANDLEHIIQTENEWNGAALKRIREARRISLEDLSDYTRISRSYLQALEDDDYNKLPALVYVRGFLQQVSRRLKLPVEAVSNAYLARLKNARPDK